MDALRDLELRYSCKSTYTRRHHIFNELIMTLERDRTRDCLLEGHMASVLSVSLSPDGQHVASGSSDKTVRIWSLIEGVCEHILSGHSDRVCVVAYSPDGLAIASGSADSDVRIWSADNGQCLRCLQGHDLGLFCRLLTLATA